MSLVQILFNIATCIAAVAFFTSFVLTFGLGKVNSRAAAIFYSIGIMARIGSDAYFKFLRGSKFNFGRYPALDWAIGILLICFCIAAAALLLPSITQRVAIRFGMMLFFAICPLLIVIRGLPDFLFRQYVYFDLAWILYAVLWFRVRDGYARIETEVDLPGVPPKLS